MIPENFKTSLNIADKQLPGFIAENENYETFVKFLEAYYEWMSETGNIEERQKNLLNYRDIDETLDEFEQFFYNEFLTYFPETTLANKRELVKLSKEFYRRKSTAASFKFLFRSLYNVDAEVYNTRESILIASDGKWVTEINLNLNTSDIRYLRTKNLKVFGETSKAIAKIERVYTKNEKIAFQITELVRNFVPGETTRIVNNELQDMFFDGLGNIVNSDSGTLLQSKVIGNIESVTIDPNQKGKFYQIGDPVSFVGGISLDVENEFSASATAEVSEVSDGKVLSINVINGGNGFRAYPNSEITITGDGTDATAKILSLDESKPANVIFWGVEQIYPFRNVSLGANTYPFISNPGANANTRLADVFQKLEFLTYPISSVEITSGGKNYIASPSIEVESYFTTLSNTKTNIKELGILSPINISHGGFNCSVGEEIVFTGGTGFGAFANVRSVDSNGTITSIQYYQKQNELFPLGGMGYRNEFLPSVTIPNKTENKATIVSAAANTNVLRLNSIANLKIGMYVSGNGIANLTTFNTYESNTTITKIYTTNNSIVISNNLLNSIPSTTTYNFNYSPALSIKSVLGDGEELQAEIDAPGEIRKITLTYEGENYVETPTVSLKIVDIIVTSNALITELPPKGSFVYQSLNENALDYEFYGYLDNIISYGQKYILRLYDFSGSVRVDNLSKPLYIDTTEINSKDFSFIIDLSQTDKIYTKGVRYYGNGTAKATATLLSGVSFGNGRYLNSDGFLSSDKVLESSIYNDYTYFLTAQKEFNTYKNVVKNILHPAGTQLIGRNVHKSNNLLDIKTITKVPQKVELKYVTYPKVNAEIAFVEALAANTKIENLFIYNNAGLPAPSNIVAVNNVHEELSDVYLSDVISVNSYISLTTKQGENFTAQVESVDDYNHFIYLKDYMILSYANVAYGFTGATQTVTAVVCRTVNQNQTMTITAPTGYKFSSVDFASYGTPTGSCGNFSYGSCHSDISKQVVENRILGRSSNTIPATVALFGDPCYASSKRLYVQATASANVAVPANNITITAISNAFDLINNGKYSNTNNRLIDIVKPNDYVLIKNNTLQKITRVDYDVENWTLYVENPLYVAGTENDPVPISIVRNFQANSVLIDTDLIYERFLAAYGNDIYGSDINNFYIENEDGLYIKINVRDIIIANNEITPISPLTYYTFIGVDDKLLGSDPDTLVYVEKV